MAGKNGLCFLIADGEHARVVFANGENVLRTVRSFDSASAHVPSHEIGSDRPGRAFESARPGSHGVTPRHDPHQLEKLHFADFVADEIGIAAGEGAFDRLVLVAPAYCLNEIEDALDGHTASMIAGRLAKDLVKTPDHELLPHLRAWMAAPWCAT
ncbi:MAG TPA: host attachment protein [Acetobacteraceae bacterium]|jgi:protein required for attachment to host cells|nr:host attachment protein [Acetobacteraceae bacterium]